MMQEKKNKQRLILLVVLLLITAATVWLKLSDTKGAVDKNHFKDFDFMSVDKVQILSGKDTVTLSYNGSTWKVNDQWTAERKRIDLLFATMTGVEAKRPISRNQNDSVYTSLLKDGEIVTFFSKGKIVEEIVTGGNAQKTNAYFSKLSEKKVYLVNIPGYRVFVSGIFELPVGEWREKRVFAFNWENFQQMDVEIPSRPDQGFKIEFKDFQVSMEGVSPVDTARLNDFVDAISLLTVDTYMPKTSSLDSLLSVKPIETLTISDIAGRKYSLSLYSYKKDRIAGLVNEKDWAVINPSKIEYILRPKDFFKGH